MRSPAEIDRARLLLRRALAEGNALGAVEGVKRLRGLLAVLAWVMGENRQDNPEELRFAGMLEELEQIARTNRDN